MTNVVKRMVLVVGWPIIIITVMSWWARWRLPSPASRLFTQPFIQAQIKENIKYPRHWPLWGEFIDDRWIALTNGQNCEKGFHLMTSSCTTKKVKCILIQLCDRLTMNLTHWDRDKMIDILRITFTNEFSSKSFWRVPNAYLSCWTYVQTFSVNHIQVVPFWGEWLILTTPCSYPFADKHASQLDSNSARHITTSVHIRYTLPGFLFAEYIRLNVCSWPELPWQACGHTCIRALYLVIVTIKRISRFLFITVKSLYNVWLTRHIIKQFLHHGSQIILTL